MKQILIKLILLTVCFVGQLWNSAMADQGNLILPTQADGNIELIVNRVSVIPAPEILTVFIGTPEECCEDKTPIAGKYYIDGLKVIFDPAFSFIEGQSYTIQSLELDPEGATSFKRTAFMIQSKAKAENPKVVSVYPSGTEIPENTLRFYIQFSTPMKPHLSSQFIKLVDANGKTDTDAFMMFKQELWDENRTRLTLLMDPGRIKRGVAQNLTLGPALLEGNTYTLVIENGWPSAAGEQKAPRFEKPFMVSKALRTKPDTQLWQFNQPRPATKDPLIARFDRPFDHQLARRAIKVFDQEGDIISGTVSLESNEKTWLFQPNNEWNTKTLQITVDARLEDVAGNNFRELLDHSVETNVENIDQETITLDLNSYSK